MGDEIYQFDPVAYSKFENDFLLDALGKPPVVALRDVRPGVNINAVRPILTRVYELEQLKEHEGYTWIGVERLREAIKVWLRENAKWASDHKRNKRAPRWPSLYSYDSKGRPHKGGIGSDSGRVRSYFDTSGNRLPFAVDLVSDDRPEWSAPGFTEAPDAKSLLTVDADKNRIECGICNHAESFKPASRASYNAARARMSKHLRRATEEREAHMELHTNEFHS